MKETAYAIAGLALLTLIYFGSYIALLLPGVTARSASGEPKPRYRFGGDVGEFVFYPAFALDRQVRPERWPPIPDTGVVIF